MNLSQNFIKSPQLVSQLISYTNLQPDETVIEIGPGRGIITQKLLESGLKVIAIEKDRRLITGLKHQFLLHRNFSLIEADFLDWNLPKTSYKIFSNIPFSITAPIIDKILKSTSKPLEIYLILQQEAADKFCLTSHLNHQDAILIAPFYLVEILGDIDRTAFTPKPQVNVVFAKFSLKSKPEIEIINYQEFRDFVIFGFNQWKPDIFEIYKKVFSYDQFRKINHRLKLNSLKPTQLNYSQWLDLFDIYQKFVPESKKKLIFGFEKQYLSHIKPKS